MQCRLEQSQSCKSEWVSHLTVFSFYHYIKEKKDVLMAASSSEKCYWKRRKNKNILLRHGPERNNVTFNLNIGNICLIL